MKGFDHVHADERVARHRIGGTDEDVAAPQGQALILELQRLRQAFEQTIAGPAATASPPGE
jgi:HlyD family secretion protein